MFVFLNLRANLDKGKEKKNNTLHFQFLLRLEWIRENESLVLTETRKGLYITLLQLSKVINL